MYIHVSTTEPNPTVWLLLNFKNNNVQRANIAVRTLTVCHRSTLNNQSDVWKQSEYLSLHYISGVYIKVLTVTIKPLNQSLKRFKPKYQHSSTLSSSYMLNFTWFCFIYRMTTIRNIMIWSTQDINVPILSYRVLNKSSTFRYF